MTEKKIFACFLSSSMHLLISLILKLSPLFLISWEYSLLHAMIFKHLSVPIGKVYTVEFSLPSIFLSLLTFFYPTFPHRGLSKYPPLCLFKCRINFIKYRYISFARTQAHDFASLQEACKIKMHLNTFIFYISSPSSEMSSLPCLWLNRLKNPVFPKQEKIIRKAMQMAHASNKSQTFRDLINQQQGCLIQLVTL